MIFLKIEKIATSNTKLYLQIIIFWKASILNGIFYFVKYTRIFPYCIPLRSIKVILIFKII